MYTINSGLREKIYNGGLSYTPIVKIGNTTIDNSNLKSLKCTDPIIDKTSNVFYIGSFISKQLEMEFKNIQEIPFSSQIDFKIQIVDTTGTYGSVTVPIGIFNIETSPEDYYKTAKITALDNAVKFKGSFTNIHNYFDDTTDDISVLELLNGLCDYYGVTLGSYPTGINENVRTGFYDNGLSGKQYVSYIAEIMGCNAKIDRLGRLILVKAKNSSGVTIDALKSKSFALDNRYKVEDVMYDNGVVIPYHYTTQTITNNRLTIRPDNIFVVGDDTARATILGKIANEVIGLDIYNLSTENRIDFTLDSTDVVTFTLGENSYTTYYDNSFNFNGVAMGKVSVEMPNKNVEETSNYIDSDDRRQVRILRTEIDSLNNTITQQAGRIQSISDTEGTHYSDIINRFSGVATTSQLNTLATSVTNQLSDTYTKTEVQAIITGTDQNGNIVQYVRAGSATFDIDGLTINDSNSKVKSNLNSEGLSILDKTNNEELLYVGYNNDINETQVRTKNLKVSRYFEMGTYSRFEDFVDDNGHNTTACFWLGD